MASILSINLFLSNLPIFYTMFFENINHLKIVCLNSDLNYFPLYYSPLFNLHFYLNLNLLYLFIFIYKFDYLLFFYKYSTFYSLFSIKEY